MHHIKLNSGEKMESLIGKKVSVKLFSITGEFSVSLSNKWVLREGILTKITEDYIFIKKSDGKLLCMNKKVVSVIEEI